MTGDLVWARQFALEGENSKIKLPLWPAVRRAPRTTVQTQPRPRGCGVRQPSAGLGGHIPVVALRPCLPQKGRELFPEPGKVNAGAGAPSGPTSSPALPLQLQPLRSRASSSFPPHSQCGSGQQALDIQMGHCEGQPGWSLGLKIQKEEVLWRFQREAASSCASSWPEHGSCGASGQEMNRGGQKRGQRGLQVGVRGTNVLR